MIPFDLTPVAANHVRCTGCSEYELLGDIPLWLSEHNAAGAVDQIDGWYRHGGGWRDHPGFDIDLERLTLNYPGDPALPAIAQAQLRDERIILFDGSWLAVIQADGSHRVARID
ncbi:MAG: hypothetical protein KAY22_12505 [Rhizorhabdus sp.]|uniref:hypothetical protein n=1 Tax=Rhizorhabdus sp. TaxID=1968843 RepID=UPI001B70E8C1|nr:hypothetical protein [Rhizorhabdus sp.]MBP8233120.1 hypothetical protein [Rhizorhabdus sp.]